MATRSRQPFADGLIVLLIVDTNRIIAALLRDSTSRRILFSSEFRFMSLTLAGKEIARYANDLIERSGHNKEMFTAVLRKICSRIRFFDDREIQMFTAEAKGILDSIDPKDTPFIALALAVENDGIWSDDKHFEQQSRVHVWKTKDLLKLLGLP